MWSAAAIRSIRSIVFDLDGTLYACPALAEDIDAIARQLVARSRGIGLAQARRILASAGQRLEEQYGAPPTLTRCCRELGIEPLELHRELQRQLRPEDHLQPDPILGALLESLADYCDLYLYTNNDLPLSRRILALLGVGELFHRLYTIEFCWRPKPDPEALRRVLEDIGGPPESFLFVGDRQAVDLDTPAQFGIATLLVRETADLLQVHRALGLVP